MKSWATALGDVHCGFCDAFIRRGSRFGVLESAGMRKVRCGSCFRMHHQAPEDTGPELTVTQTPRSPDMQRVGECLPAGFDVKLRQCHGSHEE